MAFECCAQQKAIFRLERYIRESYQLRLRRSWSTFRVRDSPGVGDKEGFRGSNGNQPSRVQSWLPSCGRVGKLVSSAAI